MAQDRKTDKKVPAASSDTEEPPRADGMWTIVFENEPLPSSSSSSAASAASSSNLNYRALYPPIIQVPYAALRLFDYFRTIADESPDAKATHEIVLPASFRHRKWLHLVLTLATRFWERQYKQSPCMNSLEYVTRRPFSELIRSGDMNPGDLITVDLFTAEGTLSFCYDRVRLFHWMRSHPLFMNNANRTEYFLVPYDPSYNEQKIVHPPLLMLDAELTVWEQQTGNRFFNLTPLVGNEKYFQAVARNVREHDNWYSFVSTAMSNISALENDGTGGVYSETEPLKEILQLLNYFNPLSIEMQHNWFLVLLEAEYDTSIFPLKKREFMKQLMESYFIVAFTPNRIQWDTPFDTRLLKGLPWEKVLQYFCAMAIPGLRVNGNNMYVETDDYEHYLLYGSIKENDDDKKDPPLIYGPELAFTVTRRVLEIVNELSKIHMRWWNMTGFHEWDKKTQFIKRTIAALCQARWQNVWPNHFWDINTSPVMDSGDTDTAWVTVKKDHLSFPMTQKRAVPFVSVTRDIFNQFLGSEEYNKHHKVKISNLEYLTLLDTILLAEKYESNSPDVPANLTVRVNTWQRLNKIKHALEREDQHFDRFGQNHSTVPEHAFILNIWSRRYPGRVFIPSPVDDQMLITSHSFEQRAATETKLFHRCVQRWSTVRPSDASVTVAKPGDTNRLFSNYHLVSRTIGSHIQSELLRLFGGVSDEDAFSIAPAVVVDEKSTAVASSRSSSAAASSPSSSSATAASSSSSSSAASASSTKRKALPNDVISLVSDDDDDEEENDDDTDEKSMQAKKRRTSKKAKKGGYVRRSQSLLF